MARRSLVAAVVVAAVVLADAMPAARVQKGGVQKGGAQGLREHAVDAVSTISCENSTVLFLDPPCPAVVSPTQVCPFEQVRLTAGQWSEGQWVMSVFFATLHETVPDPSRPAVRVSSLAATLASPGEGGDGCVLEFTGATTNYSYVSPGGPYFSEETKFYSSPLIHHTEIGPLQPSTQYYYQVGRSASENAPALFREDVFFFRTPPAPGAAPSSPLDNWRAGSAKQSTMTIAMIGDIGQTYHSNQTACTIKDQLHKERLADDFTVALGVIIGDMAYADGDGNRWDTWGRLMEQTFSSLPLMVLPGTNSQE